ncbi:ATP-dependent nuclease [Phenylobacterium sp.]|jgi:hypothetical protein|uniref:ATP-dependent nuclease n=1 Tax=Phenylobacterium sp. TaxID=1871053 RepID=UPI002F40893C
MKLIKKIEVNYLRSLYGATLDDVGDMNVIFGRNDSGKSNLLRALNLFFNGDVEAGRKVEFDVDLSDQRRQEARDAKGKQFVWIKITFNVPDNYVQSVGKEVAVKRQWNRGGDLTQTVFPHMDTAGKSARLTRFLNDIDFAYIPAIKDLNVYADLIERMYGAASETEALRDATTRFVDAIAEQTTSLSDQLGTLFGAPAKLAPPTEMSRLFRNLDFAHGAAGHSMLRQKGDGIKARHLPELLRFINENEPRKKTYLWGFEEPENSLDLGAAELEAHRFADFAARVDTQVFITSHSPAFYLANEAGEAAVRRYFITRQEPGPDGTMNPSNAASLINRLEDAELRMEQAGLLQLPFVIRRMGEQREALRAKEAEAEALREELEQLKRPALFVEGVHDVEIFSAAFSRIGIGEEVDVKPLGGTPQTSDALLSAVLEQGGIRAAAPTLFLFDDDKAGRSAARKLAKGLLLGHPVDYRDNTKVWVLPQTDEFKLFLRRRHIGSDQAFFTAEFLYPVVESAALCMELADSYPSDEVTNWRTSINGDYWPSLGQVKCHELANAEPGSADWFYSRGVPPSLKRLFAREAAARGFATEVIDAVAEVARENLR